MVAWNYGLFGCFEDMKICALTLFCPCYIFGKTANTVNRNCIFCGILLLIPFVNLYAFGKVRNLIRKHLNIDGTGSDDCILTLFCAPCALAQEAREVRHETHIMLRY